MEPGGYLHRVPLAAPSCQYNISQQARLHPPKQKIDDPLPGSRVTENKRRPNNELSHCEWSGHYFFSNRTGALSGGTFFLEFEVASCHRERTEPKYGKPLSIHILLIPASLTYRFQLMNSQVFALFKQPDFETLLLICRKSVDGTSCRADWTGTSQEA